jgi:glycosyltransferase involved in cell wall biosynthesis
VHNDLKVSIITVVYNSAETIEDCIQNVAAQTLPNLDHVIIDGGSTDGTLDVISRFTSIDSRIAKVISEPDNGLYDAMNKGIKLAIGDIIGILNSDDVFADENVEIIKKYGRITAA